LPHKEQIELSVTKKYSKERFDYFASKFEPGLIEKKKYDPFEYYNNHFHESGTDIPFN
jgi:hypothetical protein